MSTDSTRHALETARTRTAIVIPVYNHGGTLRQVVERTLSINPIVLVVDDGSTDDVAERLRGLKVRLLRHPGNLGKGAAIQTGAREARAMGMSHIITIDADGQHNPDDLHKFLSLIESDPDIIAVGKRTFDSRAPLLSRFGRSFSNFWYHVQTGWAVGDAQSGFRSYPLEVLQQLKLRQKRYAFEIEVLVKAAWGGMLVKDVPISVFYPAGRERISHFSILGDNLRLTLLNTCLTMRALIPFPHRTIVLPHHRTDSEGKISLLFHPIRSLGILIRQNLLPPRLAAAGALGVFLGTLPLVACHTLVILASASFLRLSKATAVSASQVCMPPLVPAICMEVGYYLRHGRFLTEVSLRSLGYQGLERIYEWLLGSLIVGPVLAVIIGIMIYLGAVAAKWGFDGRRG